MFDWGIYFKFCLSIENASFNIHITFLNYHIEFDYIRMFSYAYVFIFPIHFYSVSRFFIDLAWFFKIYDHTNIREISLHYNYFSFLIDWYVWNSRFISHKVFYSLYDILSVISKWIDLFYWLFKYSCHVSVIYFLV